jgi:hypothetical protein
MIINAGFKSEMPNNIDKTPRHDETIGWSVLPEATGGVISIRPITTLRGNCFMQLRG